MKSIKKNLSHMYLSIFLGTSFLFQSCVDPSKTIDWCSTLANADLIIEGVGEVLTNQSIPGEIEYDLFHDLLNSAAHFTGCGDSCGVEVAASQSHQQRIYYSENGNDWGEPINTTDVIVDPLAGCQSAKVKYAVRFLIDGYYLIESIADAYNDVNEYNENNNIVDEPLGRRQPNIIRIEGLKSVPNQDPDGNPVYMKLTSTDISYQ